MPTVRDGMGRDRSGHALCRPATAVYGGDSLTASNYADTVAARFGATVIDAGLGGQTTLQVAPRYGAAPVTVVAAGG